MMYLSASRRALLQRCGAVVLFVGICLGAFIYWSSPQGNADPNAVYGDSSLSLDDSRRYAHDTEVNSGKVGLLIDKWTRSAAHLMEPKPLGLAVIAISAMLAGGCFWAGAERR
jgi:hypothetical protein